LLGVDHGAQRASHARRTLLLMALIGAVILVGSGAAPVAASASTAPRVVVVVGPVGSETAAYIAHGRRLAAQARQLGASVTEIYSPNATWSRVTTASRGANVLIYIGHGNGSPSPYPSIAASIDGLGLNASAGHGNSNVRYYGETYVARDLRLAANAVVILNHLCYASGNNEWGAGNPTRSVAIERVDNYGAAFLRTGARAVFAEGITNPGYILADLIDSTRTMREIFWASPTATNQWTISFASKRSAGSNAVMDPYAPNRYYRSVIGDLDMTTTQWRTGG
jgi:hypothetical protein